MTLRTRVLVVALAAMAAVALMGVQMVLRYAEASDSVDRVVETLAPASAALADLDTDINNMDRRLRLNVSSGEESYRLLYAASATSAISNVDELDALLGDRRRYAGLISDVAASLQAWLDRVGTPGEAAMAAGDPGGAQEILDSRRAQTTYLELTSDAYQLSRVLASDSRQALADTREGARRLAWSIGQALAVSLLIPLAGYVALRRHVLSPITALRAQLRVAATPGQHDSEIVPSGPPELRDLGQDAEALRRALVHEIDESGAARQALEQEGPVVTAIRHELAARTDPGPIGVRISGVLRPAEGVLAGDFWDRLALPDGRAAILVCDVSGHGPRAGIVAMRLKTAITLGLVSGQPMPQILHRSCDAFADEPGRFATVVLIVADPRTGSLEWVNAGHPAPRLVRGSGVVERLAPTGPMVSWLTGVWTTGTTPLGADDVCLAFTDGILESRDADGHELGDDAFDARLREAADGAADPAEITARVLAGVRDRAEDLGRDDVTLVALRLDPAAPSPARPRAPRPLGPGAPT
jgi:serine phosphatase RsbU (regulator of sigma subunit)/CHASE3 domain sensor protein